MAGVDKELSALEERRALRKRSIAEREKREAERCKNVSLSEPSSNSEGETCDAGTSSDDAIEELQQKVSATLSIRRVRPANIVTPYLASELDRVQMTDRKAAFVIAA